jgi:crossover junction endodeoxyribonuclease RuvC
MAVPVAPELGTVKQRNVLDVTEVYEAIAGMNPDFAVVEFVQAMAKQGVTSMFRFGESFGIVKGILCGMRIPFTEIRPQVWKSRAKLTGKSKEDGRILATKMFDTDAFHPVRKKQTLADCQGMADAAMVGYYGAQIAAKNGIIALS